VISYSGYNVEYAGTNRDTCRGHLDLHRSRDLGRSQLQLPDFPITGVVRDDVTGDLYASSDFGVMKLPAHDDRAVAGTGLPNVEVRGSRS